MQMRAGWKRAAVVAAFVACVYGPVRAQNAAGGVTALRPMDPDVDPDWEVVTVKPSDPNDTHDRFDMKGRHLIIESQTVEMMLLVGYGVQKNQILSAQDWVKTQRFDVDGVADAPGEPGLKQYQSLVRKLLTERFGLKLHREQREMPVFTLTVVKGGPKLTPNTSNPNGLPNENGGGSGGQQSQRFTNTSMSDLALMLLIYVDRPIVDQTGLKGRYDFKLRWTTDETRTAEADAPPGLFTAIQEQIGLKLEPVKASADVLVVDAVERPAAN